MNKKIILGSTIGFLTLTTIGLASAKFFNNPIINEAKAYNGYTITIGGTDGQWFNNTESILKTDQNKNNVTFLTNGVNYDSINNYLTLSVPEEADRQADSYNIINKTVINQIEEVKIYGVGTFEVDSGYFEYNTAEGKYFQTTFDEDYTISQTSSDDTTPLVYDFSGIKQNFFLVRNAGETTATISKIVITFGTDACEPAPSRFKVVDGLIYAVHDDYASIAGTTNNDSYHDVEATIDGLPVRSIDPYAFKNASNLLYRLRNVPSTLVEIGESAFENAVGFVGFSDSSDNQVLSQFTYIGDRAFKNTKFAEVNFCETTESLYEENSCLSNASYLGEDAFESTIADHNIFLSVDCGTQSIDAIKNAFGEMTDLITHIKLDLSIYNTAEKVNDLVEDLHSLPNLVFIGDLDDTPTTTEGLFTAGGFLFENREFDNDNDILTNTVVGAYLICSPLKYCFTDTAGDDVTFDGFYPISTNENPTFHSFYYYFSHNFGEDALTIKEYSYEEPIFEKTQFVGIASNAFENCLTLNSINLAYYTYVDLESNAFNGCSNLKAITIYQNHLEGNRLSPEPYKEIMHICANTFAGVENLEYFGLPRAIVHPDANYEGMEHILKKEGLKVGIESFARTITEKQLAKISPSLKDSFIFGISEDPDYGIINYIKDLDALYSQSEYQGDASVLTMRRSYKAIKEMTDSKSEAYGITLYHDTTKKESYEIYPVNSTDIYGTGPKTSE